MSKEVSHEMINDCIQFKLSIIRIQDFLKSEELDKRKIDDNNNNNIVNKQMKGNKNEMEISKDQNILDIS